MSLKSAPKKINLHNKKQAFKNFKKRKNGVKVNPEDEEIKELNTKYDLIKPSDITSFTELPLSNKTLKGLTDCDYKKPTEIQRESIGHALKGKDILGAAMTGSGKTLAFLIPVLENLFLKKWTRMDGVGAIIISPTRELAYQIFETLKKVGAHHDISAGLVIGGKNLKFEKRRMDQVNIIICTPGRLLQHMDENPLFDCASMQILVLDEADRCLDMGFEQTMNGILENLPTERQTLLFSATQTKSVRDLARLSLNDPVYVAPHDQSEHSTPTTLQQNYVVVNLEDKITMLWSFIKNHLRQKCIVFLSSCKQVKYIYEIFCKLRPGTSLLALYGTLHQDRRVAIYNEFCRKSNVVLFATDVASRGLDFPVVNWVIQLDCPEDATAYIHRAGRAARHNAKGENLLVLLPSEEEAMVEELKGRKIPINKISIDARRLFSPRAKVEGYLAQNTELKATAQRAFISYIKSVFLMKNKKIFKVDSLNVDEYAKSLGLVVTPRVRFLQRIKKNQAIQNGETVEDDEESEEELLKQKKPKERPPNEDFKVSSDEESEDDGLFKVKRRDHEIDGLEEDEEPLDPIRPKKNSKPLSKAALAKKVVKKKIKVNKIVAFDEEGEQVVDTAKELQSSLAKEYLNSDEIGGIDIEKAKMLIQEEDVFDKKRFKELVQARHKEKKKKEKKHREEEDMDEFGTDDEEEGPDLSWLPDPDQIYGEKTPGDSDDDFYQKPAEELIVKKKKTKSEEPPKKKRKKNLVTNLSINEAEAMAMKLLNSV